MQCVTPMFRMYDFASGETKKIVPRQEVMEGLEMNPNTIRFQLDKMNRMYLKRGLKIQTIPCGYCWACKLTKSAEWATRCTLETLEHDHNYFLTLTYNEENLPVMEKMTVKKTYKDGTEENIIYENDGTWIDGCLVPEHVTKFIHDLREYYRTKHGITGIRYFYCGEYGTENKRPHYHMLLYGAPLNLSQNYRYEIDDNYKEHWRNEQIDKLWGKGYVDIANIEWSDAAYVARYSLKKINPMPNSEEYYAQEGKIKEFIRMSRMPGIGMKYYHGNKLQIFENDEMIMKTVKGNTGSFKPPKAFDRLFKAEYPEEWKRIEKRRHECAERSRKNLYYLSNYTDLDNLEHKAEAIATKANMLKREL